MANARGSEELAEIGRIEGIEGRKIEEETRERARREEPKREAKRSGVRSERDIRLRGNKEKNSKYN